MLSLVLLLQAATAAPPAPPVPPATDKRICRTFTETGSRLAKKRICMTKAEWDEEQRETQRNSAPDRLRTTPEF